MTVSLEYREDLAIIWVDNPPVNAINHSVRQGILDALTKLDGNKYLLAIILACRGRTFLSGADIAEFGKPAKTPILPDVLDHIERMHVPVIAALFGSVLGGGFESALCCHYRIAANSTKVGFPEVNLGLIPGAGGTQRLPRLIGVEAAVDVITSGAPLSAKAAQKVGAVDQISDGDLLEDAITFAKDVGRKGLPTPLSQCVIEDPGRYEQVFVRARQTLATSKKGFYAPLAAVVAIEAAVNLSFKEGLAYERKVFEQLRDGAESKALRHMFFAEREVTKIPDIGENCEGRSVTSVGVIGAGTMGTGIAMAFLNAGFRVTLVDASNEALKHGLSQVEKTYDRQVVKGRMTEDAVRDVLSALSTSLSYDELVGADLIIEAVFEEIDVKKEVFRKMDRAAKAGAILATNTSYLDVNAIAGFTDRPTDVIGLHFFSPAHIMKLLEIVRADATSREVLQTCLKLSKRLGKVGVVSGVCHGFIGNRMLQGYQREAGLLVLEGASPMQVDRALTEFGFAMGPFAVGDLAGLDIGYMNRKSMAPEDYEPQAFLVADRLVEHGRKGQKTGAGWYKYDSGDRTPRPDRVTKDMIDGVRADVGIKSRPVKDQEIVERCVYALVNEGARIVDEGIAYRASDIDVVYVNGYGFPRYRGGPMHYAQTIGLKTVYETITSYKDRFGPRWWTPSPYLHASAQGDGTW